VERVQGGALDRAEERLGEGACPKGTGVSEEADNGAVRIIWAGESEYSASELLQTVRVDRAGARREAEDFLAALLSDGPMPKAIVEEEAKAANISPGTLRRAKTSLGVIAERENEIGGERGAGRWVWKLPATEGTGRGVQFHDVQHAQRGDSEHLERLRSDGSPESSLDMPNLQDAQATATSRPPNAGEHLEQSTRGESHVLPKGSQNVQGGYRQSCMHGFPGGVGCYLCDSNHPYRLKKGGATSVGDAACP
jgi:hypothetical protein